MKVIRKTLFGVISIFIILITAGGFFPEIIEAADTTEKARAQVIVDQSVITVKEFMKDQNMEWLQKNLKNAKGLLIIPDLLKAGFIWGGSGGNGLLIVRDKKTGKWGQPAFYGIGSVSFGLQIGANASQVIIMVNSEQGVEKLYSSSVKLGGDASIAVGPVGGGAGAATNIATDFISFARAKGAFAGLALEGSVIKTNDDMNDSYYGKTVSPIDIIVNQEVHNPGSQKLINAVTKAAK